MSGLPILYTTGTQVSILFIDKANTCEDAFLMDASSLGTEVKDGKNQRTVLDNAEVERITGTFINRKLEDDFSVSVPFEDIKQKGYSFSAGQYFEVKIEHIDISAEEFAAKMNAYKTALAEKFESGHKLEKQVVTMVGELIL